jgi:hypothetical protein
VFRSPDSLSPSPSPSDHGLPRDGARPAQPFRASDRLLAKAGRLVAAQPYIVGSLALHVLLVFALWQVVDHVDTVRARSDAARATARDARALAQTAQRETARRVERMAKIRGELEAAAGTSGGASMSAGSPSSPASASPSAEGDGSAGDESPEALAARARALADAIDRADRELRAAALARATGLSLADARHEVEARAARERPPAVSGTPSQVVATLEQRARDALASHTARLATAREGVSVSRATPPAPTSPASAVDTGQARAADGIPRSATEQLASMVRRGPAKGRVGVVGTEAGRSINLEFVQGVEGGKIANAQTAGPDHREDGGPPVSMAGGSLDLTGSGRGAFHAETVRIAAPSPIDEETLHTGAGRTFGAGGTYATRVYLDSWYVIGPFAAHGRQTMETPWPPEEDVDLDAAYHGADGRVLTWRYASRGFYPFVPPDRTDDAVYYAYTELRVDEDQDVWLDLGSDDESMLWLDGRLVWVSQRGDKPWYHAPYYFRDEQVASLALVEGHRRVRLLRGRHRLLLKLYNDSGLTFFSVVVAS